MSKILYARIPDADHDWLLAKATSDGVSMGEIVRRLVEEARQSVTINSAPITES